MAKMVFNLILCAVDFSPESMKALTMAESLLNSESGTKLLIVYAYEPVSMPLPDYLTSVESGIDIDSYLEKARAMMTNNVERINMEFGSEVCEGKIVMGKAQVWKACALVAREFESPSQRFSGLPWKIIDKYLL